MKWSTGLITSGNFCVEIHFENVYTRKFIKHYLLLRNKLNYPRIIYTQDKLYDYNFLRFCYLALKLILFLYNYKRKSNHIINPFTFENNLCFYYNFNYNYYELRDDRAILGCGIA